MRFAKVTAIVRCARLEDVERALRLAAVEGMTVSHVRGYGEYANYFHRDWTTTHARLEIFVPSHEAGRVAGIITTTARTGAPGDGVVAILPVERFYHIRTHDDPGHAASEADRPDQPAVADVVDR